MKHLLLGLPVALTLTLGCSSRPAHENFLAVHQSPADRAAYEAYGDHFAMATQGQASTEAARTILAAGGNIIDAAIAASFTISVERPQSTGLGGGGFLLYREAKTGRFWAVDFRERAPLRARAHMFLDKKGEVIEDLSSEGPLSVAVPGLVAGLAEIHQRFGKLPLKKVMEPAIRLAEEGLIVYPHLANALKSEVETLRKYPSSAKIFLKHGRDPYTVGERLVQKDLGRSLRVIAAGGARAFYRGSLGKTLLAELQRYGAIVSQRDFGAYQVKWREALRSHYKGFDILSFPPPSSGGTHVGEILNILARDSLKESGFGSARDIHLKASAMQQAFADRAQFMGDPDFVKGLPLKGLLSTKYAEKIRAGVDLDHAKKSEAVAAGPAPDFESSETTHFSMMDAEGNVVVSTQTINGYFGSKIVAEGSGIVFNNEMDDFSAKVGAANIFGAIGGSPNAIAPKKTPLSSMSPTIVMKGSEAVMALGAPGGTRIITCVAQSLLNRFDHGMSPYEAIHAFRIHHQWKPDLLEIEAPGPGVAVRKELLHMGYSLKEGSVPCRVNAVGREGQRLWGVADGRDLGAAWAE